MEIKDITKKILLEAKNGYIKKDLTVFCDVDDTLIDHLDNLKGQTVEFLEEAKANGCKIYLWSQGGEQYCKEVAEKTGTTHLFDKYLDKPDICLDDLEIKAPFIDKYVHPGELVDQLSIGRAKERQEQQELFFGLDPAFR